jgi:hypothetical protein
MKAMKRNFKSFLQTLLVLSLCMSFSAVSAQQIQENSEYGFSYIKSEFANYGSRQFLITNVVPNLPADKAGLKRSDVIISVNGKDAADMDAIVEPVTNIEVRKLGKKETVKIVMPPPVNYPKNAISEGTLVYILSSFSILDKPLGLNNNLVVNGYKRKIESFSDPEEDLLGFYSFDFEYTNTDNPAFEKEVAYMVQKNLEAMGLKRDKETPDCLIFIDFYTGKAENYVEPRQELRTRYQTKYNYFTQRYETLQYLETDTKGGYTVSTYIYNLKLTFLNAAKAKMQADIAPVIWQAEFNSTTETSWDIKTFANIACNELIGSAYPYKVPYNYKRYYVTNHSDCFCSSEMSFDETKFNYYYYTGIHYCNEKNLLNKVVFVASGSPADKAGIQAGDIITKIETTKLVKNRDDAKWCNKSVIKDLIRCSCLDNPWGTSKGFEYMAPDRVGREDDIIRKLTFEIQRGKQKLTVTVDAQRKEY